MSIYLTRLVRIQVPSGSQIRLEMYCKANDNYAQYYFSQDVQNTVNNQADLIEIDRTSSGRSVRAEAESHIEDIGDTDGAYAFTNIMDVDMFAPKKPYVKAKLTFSKESAHKFRLALWSYFGGDDAVCSWSLKGKIDDRFKYTPIRGHLVRVDGRPAYLIDI
ncbi:hypothetical protein [Methylobacterium dankookense]|nr:hypothetical protein [Methylobacterium dankookense]